MRKGDGARSCVMIALADIKPEIWRRIIVSPETTLHELHRIIQLMLEWWIRQISSNNFSDHSLNS